MWPGTGRRTFAALVKVWYSPAAIPVGAGRCLSFETWYVENGRRRRGRAVTVCSELHDYDLKVQDAAVGAKKKVCVDT